MGLLDFLFNKANYVEVSSIYSDAVKLYVNELAIQRGITLYANVISKCEFQRIKKEGNKLMSVKNDLYYTLNIRPNQNSNATVFWNKAITQLFKNGEVLIVQGYTNELFLAESFSKRIYAYKPWEFYDVVINNLNTNKTYLMGDAIYLTIENMTISKTMSDFYEKLSGILDAAVNNYKQNNGKKYKFNTGTSTARRGIGATPDTTTEGEEIEKTKAQQYVDKLFEKIFTTPNAIVPLQTGEELEELGKVTGQNSEDIVKMINTTMESVAIGMNIPIDIFIGRTTEKSNAMNDWITTGVEIFLELIGDELNAKLISKANYLKGDQILIDATKINHRDILDSAVALEKLFGIGFTHNEIRGLFKMLPTTDEGADDRHWSKNYGTESEFKGGEKG
ncbi:phage portal protein [Alkalibaculum sporogenes]|uniref:phage portal protein n=1 Tax=Alkalibaculum sporogenes TaxID=2655001 RepID=UPI00128B4AF2|nr:phage portal protein [Alkalibaculum sporogenes]